jgi:hypothetical protein
MRGFRTTVVSVVRRNKLLNRLFQRNVSRELFFTPQRLSLVGVPAWPRSDAKLPNAKNRLMRSVRVSFCRGSWATRWRAMCQEPSPTHARRHDRRRCLYDGAQSRGATARTLQKDIGDAEFVVTDTRSAWGGKRQAIANGQKHHVDARVRLHGRIEGANGFGRCITI